MDRWLIKNPQPQAASQSHTQLHPRRTNEETQPADEAEADESGDTIMEDAPSSGNRNSFAHAGMRSIRWTPINKPWRRNSHNAALFDSPIPEGAYLTAHLRAGVDSGVLVERGARRDVGEDEVEDGAADDEADFGEEEADEDEGVDGEGDEEAEEGNEDDDPNLDYDTLHATCETLFADDHKLLKDARLITVAGLYTNREILHKVRSHHPNVTLQARLLNVTQALSDSISRVAKERGVPREVVKQELDKVRKMHGVLERQNKYNRARREEGKAAREALKGADKGGVGAFGEDGVEEDVMESDDVSERNVLKSVKSGAGVRFGDSGVGGGGKTPYGLGVRQPVRERVVRDSDEEDDEL